MGCMAVALRHDPGGPVTLVAYQLLWELGRGAYCTCEEHTPMGFPGTVLFR